jgi:hypothetical protein
MKQTTILINFLIFILLLLACRSRGNSITTISFSELISDPIKYSGKNICTEGIYLSGFEASALGADIYELNGSIYLTEPAIWIEGIEVINLTECKTSNGYSFCPAKVCGHFEYGQKYGHLGGYEYQIISSKINP